MKKLYKTCVIIKRLLSFLDTNILKNYKSYVVSLNLFIVKLVEDKIKNLLLEIFLFIF